MRALRLHPGLAVLLDVLEELTRLFVHPPPAELQPVQISLLLHTPVRDPPVNTGDHQCGDHGHESRDGLGKGGSGSLVPSSGQPGYPPTSQGQS